MIRVVGDDGPPTLVRAAWVLAFACACSACAEPVAGSLAGPGDVPGASDASSTAVDGGKPSGGLLVGAQLAYAARRGVSTPWLIRGGSTGPMPPIRLAPRRGAGYGMGEGEVAYPQLTPDGSTVVVVFYTMATPTSWASGEPVLFVLSTDGANADAPVRIALAPELHALDRAYRSGWVAWVDGDRVIAARLDGSDVASPIAIASAPTGREFGGLRWIGETGTLVWAERSPYGGSDSTVHAAKVSPSGAEPEVQVDTGAGPAAWVAGVLPGDRLRAPCLPPISRATSGLLPLGIRPRSGTRAWSTRGAT